MFRCPPKWINFSLGQQHRMTVRRAEVLAEPAHAQAQHPRGQVRSRATGKDEESSVVGDQMQAAKLLLRQPPDPPITRLELERPGVPADQCEPVLAQHRDVANASSHQTPEGQIVVRAHQSIPALALARAPRGAYRDLAQPLRNGVEHRLRPCQRACAPV